MVFITQPQRYAFLTAKPPQNYVAGHGRGATGFTTRSDIGPARPNPTPIGAVPERPQEDDEGHDMHQEFDEFLGNDTGLLASADGDEDDDEADTVYAAIDQRMDSRRRERREARKKEEDDKYNAANPTIAEQLKDLKGPLRNISDQEWESIPDIGDYTWKNRKKRKFGSFVPVPDTLFERARLERQTISSVDSKDLTALGEGRGTMMKLKLDRVSDSVSGLSSVDPTGYLTELVSTNMNKFRANLDLSDVKKHRQMFRSIRQTQPNEPRGWIAGARFEEAVGKLKEAREIIKEGCNMCPKDQDVWLEACRLVNPEEAKATVAMGVRQIPNSVDLWMRAADLEQDDLRKKKVLMRALDQSNDNLRRVRLWKAVMEFCDEREKNVMLYRAVEVCPMEVQLWIALARMETYEVAKKILNDARMRLPHERAIWVEAAKLEEAKGNMSMVGKIIERGVSKLLLEQNSVNFRETWMKEATIVERAGHVAVCQAIIQNTIGVGVEEEDRKRTWLADAEECLKSGCIETARAIYAHALTVFLTKKSIWRNAAMLEKNHGTKESLDALLGRAVKYLPQVDVFWLMAAKENWLAGDVPAARLILEEASKSLPNSENILLAAFKLEFENHEQERARILLDKIRERVDSGRVWMKSAILQRELGNSDEELTFIKEGLKRFPSFFKLWLMLGQLEERLNQFVKARAAYESGLKHCSSCIPLWLSLANLGEKMNGLSKARAVLSTARGKNPRTPELWLAAVKAELRHGNKKEAETLIARALKEQECPNSGILWAASIGMVPRPQRKTKCRDAYLHCGQEDPHVNAAVAQVFCDDRKPDKARTRFNLAVTRAPDNGDFWTMYYKFELQNGTEETQKDVLERCVAAQPKHGDKWQTISKVVENWHLQTEAILKKAVKEGAATVGNQQ